MPFIGSIEGSLGYGRPQVSQTSQLTSNANLLIWLDAANNTSYPGSGALWTNLVSGQSAYNFGLSNSPTSSNVVYNGTTNRSISFNGTNQFATPTTSLLTAAQSNNWAETREYWVYWRGIAGCLTMESGTIQPDVNWFDAQASMTSNVLAYSVWQGSGPMTAYPVYNSFTSNAWNHVIWQHNKATNTLMAYVNGIRTYSNATVTRTTPDSASSQFFTILCAGSATNFGYGSGSYLNAALGIYRWYNILLTSNQINSNYQSEKGRFGV
jgi:hypothetical protein